MIQTSTLAFLGLDEAAQALGIHPNNLQALAKSGQVPAAKVGKEWRFLDIDLATYLRAQYPANLEAEKKPCRSTSAVKHGGSTSRTKANELDNLLALPTSKPRNASTTKSKPNSGTVVRMVTP